MLMSWKILIWKLLFKEEPQGIITHQIVLLMERLESAGLIMIIWRKQRRSRKRTGTLEKGYKITGISGSGTLKLNKVTSYFLKKVSENLKKGKATRMTIITNLEDPEAFGAERIRLDDCVITELTIADWEAGKLLEESIPFNFSGFEVLDTIDA